MNSEIEFLLRMLALEAAFGLSAGALTGAVVSLMDKRPKKQILSRKKVDLLAVPEDEKYTTSAEYFTEEKRADVLSSLTFVPLTLLTFLYGFNKTRNYLNKKLQNVSDFYIDELDQEYNDLIKEVLAERRKEKSAKIHNEAVLNVGKHFLKNLLITNTIMKKCAGSFNSKTDSKKVSKFWNSWSNKVVKPSMRVYEKTGNVKDFWDELRNNAADLIENSKELFKGNDKQYENFWSYISKQFFDLFNPVASAYLIYASTAPILSGLFAYSRYRKEVGEDIIKDVLNRRKLRRSSITFA